MQSKQGKTKQCYWVRKIFENCEKLAVFNILFPDLKDNQECFFTIFLYDTK